MTNSLELLTNKNVHTQDVNIIMNLYYGQTAKERQIIGRQLREGKTGYILPQMLFNFYSE